MLLAAEGNTEPYEDIWRETPARSAVVLLPFWQLGMFSLLEPHLGHGAEQRVAGGTVADSSIQLPLWQYFLISSSPHDDNDNDNNDESLFCLL